MGRFSAIAAIAIIIAALSACAGTAAPTATPLPSATPQPTPTMPAPTPTMPAPAPTPVTYATPIGLVLNAADSFEGYTLFTPVFNKTVYLIDNQGMVAHKWDKLDFVGWIPVTKLLENGNLMFLASGDVAAIVEIEPDGDVVWEYTPEAGWPHHDFLKLPNGNVLLLTRMEKTREEAIAAGANPDYVHEDGLHYESLIEVQPDGPSGGKIVWEWSMWDHLVQDFDSDKPNYGTVVEHPELIDLNFSLAQHIRTDWIHANAIDYNPELDQIMISATNFNEIWIIDHSATSKEAAGHSGGKGGRGGDLLYRWGNPRAYGQGTADDQQLFFQHNTHWIEPGLPGAGNILIFNNGNGFDGFRRFYSSVDEIILPAEGYSYRMDSGGAYRPAELVWTYAAEKTPLDFFSQGLSSAQRLPNGNTLIDSGWQGTFFEVTLEGETVWQYINPTTSDGPLHQGAGMPWLQQPRPPLETPYGTSILWDNAVYRILRYAPDYPGLEGYDLTPGGPIELPAP